MKISSGVYKSKELLVPRSGIKPTADKVRQAVMNILQGRLTGARFLDLYCGTGAVGIEALSNGASFACFVERAERNYIMLKKNLEAIVGDKERFKTIRHNVNSLEVEMVREFLPFDIIFADPFYRDANEGMDDLHRFAMEALAPEGVFILEHGAKDDFSEYPHFSSLKKYGDTALTLFRKE